MTIEVKEKSKITSTVQPERKNSLKENLQQEIIKSSSICNLGTKTIKIIDLFAGIGGFSQAAIEFGLNCETVFASEIKKHAISVYQDNFPKVNLAKAHEAESENLFSREARSFCLKPCRKLRFQLSFA